MATSGCINVYAKDNAECTWISYHGRLQKNAFIYVYEDLNLNLREICHASPIKGSMCLKNLWLENQKSASQFLKFDLWSSICLLNAKIYQSTDPHYVQFHKDRIMLYRNLRSTYFSSISLQYCGFNKKDTVYRLFHLEKCKSSGQHTRAKAIHHHYNLSKKWSRQIRIAFVWCSYCEDCEKQ